MVWTFVPPPGSAAPLLPSVGLTQLVADDPYIALMNVSRVTSAAELREALLNPTFGYYVVAANLSLLEALAPASLFSFPLAPGGVADRTVAEMGAVAGEDAQASGMLPNSPAAQAVACASAAAQLHVLKSNVTLLGIPRSITLLDLGGCANLLHILPQARFVLRHLTLVNAGPAPPSLSTGPGWRGLFARRTDASTGLFEHHGLSNFTSLLWALNCSTCSR